MLNRADLPAPFKRSWQLFFAFLGFYLLFAGVAVAENQRENWLATDHQNHELVGRLWSVEEQQFVDPEAWLDDQPQATWLLFGEQHDHPDHQRLVGYWLQELARQQRLGVLAMEMLRHSQQEAIDRRLGQAVEDPEQLNWPERGWDWTTYAEVINQGLLNASQVLAADLDREQQLAAYQEGAPRPAVSDYQSEALDELLYEGHCQLVPRERLGAMRQVQLARDQAMAETMGEAVAVSGVHLLLAGAVHVRKDLGIPRWLPGEVQVVSVLLQEVSADQPKPEDYLPEGGDGLQAYDYIFFTPAIPPVDYCAEMQRSREG